MWRIFLLAILLWGSLKSQVMAQSSFSGPPTLPGVPNFLSPEPSGPLTPLVPAPTPLPLAAPEMAEEMGRRAEDARLRLWGNRPPSNRTLPTPPSTTPPPRTHSGFSPGDPHPDLKIRVTPDGKVEGPKTPGARPQNVKPRFQLLPIINPQAYPLFGPTTLGPAVAVGVVGGGLATPVIAVGATALPVLPAGETVVVGVVTASRVAGRILVSNPQLATPAAAAAGGLIMGIPSTPAPFTLVPSAPPPGGGLILRAPTPPSGGLILR